MKRSSRWSALAGVAVLPLLLFPHVRGETPTVRSEGKKPPAEQWLVDRSLTVTAQAAPVPALKYQLFPLYSERKPGNAVPIYLRLRHSQSDAAKKRWSESPKQWNRLPLEKLPVRQARAFLKDYRRFFQQFDLGARRSRAAWNYTLDQGSVIDLLLPDIQEMRGYLPLLELRARVDLAEGNYAATARDLETGFALSRHVAEGPFLIPSLVGIAMATRFADVVPDWIGRPGAPNLYWSLSVLPRPLIDMRKGLEFEQRVMELEFPELANLSRPRSQAQWDALLKKLRTEFKRFLATEDGGGKPVPEGTAPNDPAARSPDLAVARKYLTGRLNLAVDRVKAMPPAQVLVLSLAGVTREVRDDQFKAAYLPYPLARKYLAVANKRLKAAPDTEALRFARLLQAAVHKALAAQNRLDRKIAALRAIEALRLHAAATGQLPAELSDVTVAPVPPDPGTGKAFEYRRTGRSATLIGRIPGEPLRSTGIRYRLELRKK